MSSQDNIAALLKRWLELTHAESEAINSESWDALLKAQSDKRNLQGSLTAALDAWADENSRSAVPNPENPFRAEVNRLIVLEAGNGELLASRMSKARDGLVSLSQSSRNLRKVQGSYARKREEVWHSYS